MTLAWIIKSTFVLAAALAAAHVMRRRPASLRFAVLAAALAALLALPLIDGLIPRKQVDFQPSGTTAAAVTSTDAFGPEPVETRDWPQIIWLGGSLLLLMQTALGYVLARRKSAAVPMTVGVLRPRIVLPRCAAGWSGELHRSVTLHEQAHIARRDPLWNLLAQLARAIYWFHPLMWLALRQFRAEREHACDDAVITAGVRPSDYATHLVMCARDASSPAVALPMAGHSPLAVRVEAVLAPATLRDPLSRPQRAILAAACCALLVPLVAFGSPSISFRSLPMYRKLVLPILAAASAAQSAEISGRIYDASNATVPKAEVVLRGKGAPTEFKAVTSDTGEYRLLGLPGGIYDLEVLKPGFVMYRRGGIRLSDNSIITVSAVLSIGEVRETLQVNAPGQARPQLAAAPQRIRVGGDVRPVRILKQVKAAYPESARAEGREGNVMLKAVIGTDGNVVNVTVLPGADADLAAAAEEALRQWQYEPTLLNGRPVETVTTVEINFRLGTV